MADKPQYAIVARPKNYWMSARAVSITLNALNEANRIQASTAAGALIFVYFDEYKEIGDRETFGFDAGHNFKSWPLITYPTFFETNEAVQVHVAIPRTESVSSQAMFVYPTVILDVEGYEVEAVPMQDDEGNYIDEKGNIVDKPADAATAYVRKKKTDGSEQDADPVGSQEYYYIYLHGMLTSSGSAGTTFRKWNPMYDTGRLNTDETWGEVITLEQLAKEMKKKVDVEWFQRIFTIHGTGRKRHKDPDDDSDDPDWERDEDDNIIYSGDDDEERIIKPNDMDHEITDTESMFGFWTEEYISALGKGKGSGGSGPLELNEPLYSINEQEMGYPPNNLGKVTIVWNPVSGEYEWGKTGGGVSGLTLKDHNDVIKPLTQSDDNVTYDLAASFLSLKNGGEVRGILTLSRPQDFDLEQASPSTVLTKGETETLFNGKFVTVEFWNSLFETYNGTTKVNVNTENPVINNLKILVGTWTEQYLSALGQGSSQGGGTLDLFEPLNSINKINRNPSATEVGDTLVWMGAGQGINNSGWGYGTAGIDETEANTLIGEYLSGVTWWGRTISNKKVKGHIDMNLEDCIRWSLTGSSSPLTMVALKTDSGNRLFILGEGTTSQSIPTYLRGSSIYFQTASGSASASLTSDGLFTVNGSVHVTNKLYLYKPNAANDTGAVYLEYIDSGTNKGVHLAGDGLWSDSFISALGSGSTSNPFDLGPLLNSLNTSGLNPSAAGTGDRVLVYGNGSWRWDEYGAGGGLDVNAMWTELQTNNDTKKINNSHLDIKKLTLKFATSPAETTEVYNPTGNSDTTITFPTTLAGYGILSDDVLFDSITAGKASQLDDTVTRKLWGQTYWQNGKPASADITGDLTGSGNINMARGNGIRFKTGTSTDADAYVMALRCFVNSEVLSLGYETTAGQNNSTVGADGKGYATNIYGKTVSLFSNTSSGIAEGLTLTSTGQVGIGGTTSATDTKLYVNGNIRTGGNNGNWIQIGQLRLIYEENGGNKFLRLADTTSGGGSANFYATGAVSALGQGSTGGASTFDEEQMWEALGTSTGTYANSKIHANHLNLTGYALTADVTKNLTIKQEGKSDIVYNGTEAKEITIGSGVGDRLQQYTLNDGASLASFTHATDLIYTAKGGKNGCIDKPDNVDAFGLISFKTAVGYYGQMLMPAGVGRLYLRSSNSLNGGWSEVALTSDLTSYAKKADIRKLTVNGGTTKAVEYNPAGDANATLTFNAASNSGISVSGANNTITIGLDASSITAGKATQLASNVTLWGNAFNGTQSIGYSQNGTDHPASLSYVRDITMSGNVRMNRGQFVQMYVNNDYRNVLGVDSSLNILSLGYRTAEQGLDTNILGANVRLYYYNDTAKWQEGLTLTSTGQVGIGGTTSATDTKLYVNGNIRTGGNNGNWIQIGQLRLIYEENGGNKFLRLADTTSGGGSANFYATGAVSALGTGTTSGNIFDLDPLLNSLHSSGLNPSVQGEQVLVNNNGTWSWQEYGGSGGVSDDYLPLIIPGSGKTVSMPSIGALTFKSSASDYPMLRFEGATSGGLGFIGIGKTGSTIEPYFVTAVNGVYNDSQSKWYKLIHSGNMSELFTTLANSGDNISVTVGGTNKTLTVGFATTASRLRNLTMASGDDYDTLSLYTPERGAFVATNRLTGSAFNSITLDGKGLYDTLVSFGYGNRTIQLKGSGWSDDLKYRHVYTQPGTQSTYVLSPWKTIAFTDGTIAKADRLSGTADKTAWGRTYWSNGQPTSISGNLENVDEIFMNANKFIRIKDSESNYINMIGMDGSNNFSVFWGALAKGYTTGLYGNLVYIGHGHSGSNPAYYTSFQPNGHVTINAYDKTGYFLTVGGNSFANTVVGKQLKTDEGTAGETVVLNTSATYDCIVYQINGSSKWSVGADSNNNFYWYQSGSKKTVMSLSSAGRLKVEELQIGDITISVEKQNNTSIGLRVSKGLSATTYISALGTGSSESGGSADLTTVWTDLRTPSTDASKRIDITHYQTSLDTYLSGKSYATQNDINAYVKSVTWSTDTNHDNQIKITKGNDSSTYLTVAYATKAGSVDSTGRLSQTTLANGESLATFIHDTDLIYTAKGGDNGCTDIPTSGTVDSFGLLSFKTATYWHGQILMATGGDMYYRTGDTLSGGWKRLIDSGNWETLVTSAPKLRGSASGPFTAWGQEYWNGGVPKAVSGDIKQATSLEFSGVGGSADNGGYIDFRFKGRVTGSNTYTSRIIEDQSGIIKINNTVWAKLSGNVGIGTSDPQAKLHVNGSITLAGGSRIYQQLTNGTGNLYIGDSNNKGYVYLADCASQSGAGNWAILANGRSKFTRIWLYKSGADYSDDEGVYLEYVPNQGVRLANAGFYADGFISALGAGSSGGGGVSDFGFALNGTTLSVGTNTSVDLGSKFVTLGTTQTITGYKGIGIAAQGAPWTFAADRAYISTGLSIAGKNTSYNLYVDGTSYQTENAIFRKDVSVHSNMLVDGMVTVGGSETDSGDNNGKIYLNGDQDLLITTGNYIKLLKQTVASSKLTIGQTTPNNSCNLYVNGTSNLNGDVDITKGKTIYFQHTASGVPEISIGTKSNDQNLYLKGVNLYFNSSIISSSDMRLKDVDELVDGDIESIARAPIFYYRWKKTPEFGPHLGSSAQYWQNVFSCAVVKDEEGYLGLDYAATALASAVITARKVLDHEGEIKALRKRIGELEQEIETLKAA